MLQSSIGRFSASSCSMALQSRYCLWPRVIGLRVDVKNEEDYKPYAAANPAIFKKFGGRFLVRGGVFNISEGNPRKSAIVSSAKRGRCHSIKTEKECSGPGPVKLGLLSPTIWTGRHRQQSRRPREANGFALSPIRAVFLDGRRWVSNRR
jgi:Domain of unknown function (DUF1330)